MCLLANQFTHANYRMAYSPSPDQPCISSQLIALSNQISPHIPRMVAQPRRFEDGNLPS